MSVLNCDISFAAVDCINFRFIRRLGGSAQSLLVKDSDSRLWVLKPKTTLQGSNVLANEFIGSALCKSLGLPVPDYEAVRLSDEDCADPCMWIYTKEGKQGITPGVHFASRYLPDAFGREVYECIPPTLKYMIQGSSVFLGMFIFDVFAMHRDRRQVLFRIEQDGLHPTFFDNSHLFGGPSGLTGEIFLDGRLSQQIAAFGRHNVFLCEEWIKQMRAVVPAALQVAVARTPINWFAGDLSQLVDVLLVRLDSLPTLVETSFGRLEKGLRAMNQVEDLQIYHDFGVLTT